MLAVDVVADGGLRRALGEVPRNVEILELRTEESLEQYIDITLPLPISPSRLGPIAAIFDYVATAAPGVREILTIGKILHEVRESRWDTVVVDGPATGHCVELLAAPSTLSDLVGFGPMVDQTEWMKALLADPRTTGAIVVTTAEELPVSETLGLLERLLDDTDVDITGLVVNQIPARLGTKGRAEAEALIEAGGALGEAALVATSRSDVAVAQLARLAELQLPTVEVSRSNDPVGAVVEAIERDGSAAP